MISYIIVFAIIIAGVIIWQLRSNTHFLRLSHQEYPELSLSALIAKKERKIDAFIIQIHAKQSIVVIQIKFELISKKRAFEYISSDEIVDSLTIPFKINGNTTFEASFAYEKLKDIIDSKMSDLHSFRIAVESQNNKVYKSHELKFDKFWKIYKADTGKYN
jgi:dihydroxyacetone kinase-like predicted kinase